MNLRARFLLVWNKLSSNRQLPQSSSEIREKYKDDR